MKLYEINRKLEYLLDACVDQETGEFTPSKEAESEIAALEIERTEKAVQVGCFIKSLNAEAVALAEEEAKLRTRRSSINRRAEWLCEYLAREYEGQSIKDARCIIGWRKSVVVIVCDERVLPEEFWKVERHVMKSPIKDAIKSGTLVPGAYLEEKQNIQIK